MKNDTPINQVHTVLARLSKAMLRAYATLDKAGCILYCCSIHVTGHADGRLYVSTDEFRHPFTETQMAVKAKVARKLEAIGQDLQAALNAVVPGTTSVPFGLVYHGPRTTNIRGEPIPGLCDTFGIDVDRSCLRTFPRKAALQRAMQIVEALVTCSNPNGRSFVVRNASGTDYTVTADTPEQALTLVVAKHSMQPVVTADTIAAYGATVRFVERFSTQDLLPKILTRKLVAPTT